jgi:methionine-rich copper-binding protein CopC
MERSFIRAASTAMLLLIVAAGTAFAHGGLQASSPEDGARVSRAPRRVSMTFSEAPSKDSVLEVVDGCRRDVVGAISVEGNDLVGAIGEAQPGKWKARYRVISAEDGHLTKGTLSFTVAGKKDCNPNGDGDNATEVPAGDGDESRGSATPPGDDGSSFPVVPVAVGAAGLVLVGLVVRRVSAG